LSGSKTVMSAGRRWSCRRSERRGSPQFGPVFGGCRQRRKRAIILSSALLEPGLTKRLKTVVSSK
jgi:hypothetical protein